MRANRRKEVPAKKRRMKKQPVKTFFLRSEAFKIWAARIGLGAALLGITYFSMKEWSGRHKAAEQTQTQQMEPTITKVKFMLAEEPRVNLDDKIGYVIKGERKELESKLVKLAKDATAEDIWVYDPVAKELWEIGVLSAEIEGGKQVAINSSVFLDLLKNKWSEPSGLIIYHIHPTGKSLETGYRERYERYTAELVRDIKEILPNFPEGEKKKHLENYAYLFENHKDDFNNALWYLNHTMASAGDLIATSSCYKASGVRREAAISSSGVFEWELLEPFTSRDEQKYNDIYLMTLAEMLMKNPKTPPNEILKQFVANISEGFKGKVNFKFTPHS